MSSSFQVLTVTLCIIPYDDSCFLSGDGEILCKNLV